MKRYLPTLILAAGILVATGIAVLTWEAGWLAMAGPACLAGMVLAAYAVELRMNPGSRASVRVALLFGAIFLATGAIMALRNPSELPLTVAVLGGVSVVVFSTSPR